MKALLTIAPFVALIAVFVLMFPRMKQARNEGRQRDATLWFAGFLIGLALIVGTLAVLPGLLS